MIRRRTFFSGRVQGVGFRFSTCEVADGFDVSGFVQNLSDGRVEMVAEGEEQELDRFQAALQDRMSRFISGADMTTEPATGEFSRFAISY
ncbi:MAG: acylphosphatase [Planctomycetota bacterium]